ncbi:MAG: hypothetical protein ACR652_24515 [Methylocystis sp.]|uniref:hypothetical protein n=1 Tax=Methylocystis sp. TaxID=1911079 RepID=UPI003DA48B65
MSAKKASTVTLGWVGWEYDDGCQSVHVAMPSEFNETVRRVPAHLFREYNEAHERAEAAEKALLDAWSAAKEIRNPNYEPEPPAND